jgi:glutamate-1-semialdehyde 2,1-aminomutase
VSTLDDRRDRTAQPRDGRSRAAMERATRVLARGTSSSARLRTVTGSLVMSSADGALLTDVDGNRYIDYVLGLGPVILGHRPEAVLDAVRRSLDRAIIYGAQHEAEAELAEQLVAALPGADVVTLHSSGSEAVHFAIRVARVRTGRSRIVKFDGHYHGWIDPLFANTPWTAPIERSPVAATHAVAGLHPPADVTVARWNLLADLERALQDGPPVAAVVMEPIPCNFGTIWPESGYMEGVRRACSEHGALLVFDEVLTGFRLALGGAQELLAVVPDLTICSKAVASGFPLAIVAGASAAMAPATEGPVRAGGTFNGSPSSVAAAAATVEELSARRAELYPALARTGAALAATIREAAAAVGVPLSVHQIGSVLQLFWDAPDPVRSYADAQRSDRARIAELAGRLLEHGVHVPERGLLLLCAAHTDEHVESTGRAFRAVLEDMGRGLSDVAA